MMKGVCATCFACGDVGLIAEEDDERVFRCKVCGSKYILGKPAELQDDIL